MQNEFKNVLQGYWLKKMFYFFLQDMQEDVRDMCVMPENM
jgi:hypothetical protein